MKSVGPLFETRTLAGPIRNALAAWLDALANEPAPFAILRGHALLPERAGFDLDVLVAPESLASVLAAGRRAATASGLKAYAWRKGAHAAKLIWLSTDPDGMRRQWLLIDLQTRLALPEGHALSAADIAAETVHLGDLRLRVPDADWGAALACVHALRKGAAATDSQRLTAALERDAVRQLVRRLLGAKAPERFRAAFAETDVGKRDRALVALGRDLGVAKYRQAVDGRPLGWRGRLSRFLFYRLFFIHRHRPPLFVVTGPDGVGKSTLIGELQTILARYPFGIDRVHHLHDTKGAGWYRRSGSGASAAPPRGLAYRLARTMWRRLVPGWVKAAIVGVQGELRYAYRVNALAGDAFFAGRACLADRYAYDRKIKLEFEGRHPLQRMAAWLNCWLMRRPRLTILLRDDPELIHVRKQELSVAQIADYQTQLARLCRQVGAPSVEVNVNGRTPEAIAREVAGLVLDALGSDVFHLVGAWEKGARPAHC